VRNGVRKVQKMQMYEQSGSKATKIVPATAKYEYATIRATRALMRRPRNDEERAMALIWSREAPKLLNQREKGFVGRNGLRQAVQARVGVPVTLRPTGGADEFDGNQNINNWS
jgi:hypothetical protein